MPEESSEYILPESVIRENEIFWKIHYNWLKDKGYKLRPRYAPDWSPSWKGTKRNYMSCEDGYALTFTQINDATTPDGARVALKRVDKNWNPLEEDITRRLSTEPLSKDVHNHCVPLLDVLEPPTPEGEVKYRVLVLPLLRVVQDPIFDTVGEVIDCVRQLFEGVQFMHQNHIVHRDISFNNFMMSTDMFPDGYHTQCPSLKRDASGKATFLTRTQRPPKYYLLDFGISRQYDVDNISPREAVIVGADPTVPEFQNHAIFHNPYPTDVYLTGNLVRQLFLDGHPILTTLWGCTGLEFLRPLIEDMVQNDPDKRPKMDEVVPRFEALVKPLSTWKLRSRTSSRRANIFQDTAHLFGHWGRKLVFVATRAPAVPQRSM